MRKSSIFELLNLQSPVTGNKVILRPRRLEDAIEEYRWRTDEELCRLDATVPLEVTFTEFRNRYAAEIEYPGLTYTLAIDTFANKHIGNCSLFNLDFANNNAEVGLMIGEKIYWDQGYGSDALQTFLGHIFKHIDIGTILLRTLDWNKRAQRCFLKAGFKPCGKMVKEDYNFVIMKIDCWQVTGKDQ
jgi:RimJ/RimL family protein N-acetyltransferase